MDMSGAQLDELDAFVGDPSIGSGVLMGGTLAFRFPDPRHDGATLLVRFADDLPSNVSRGPDIWTVSLDLEILP